MIEISEYVLSTIAHNVQPLQNGRFVRVEYQEREFPKEAWFYPEPLTFTASPHIGGTYKNSRGAIVSLNFPEQVLLQNRVKERLGVNIRHGSLKENFIATRSKKAKEYLEKVLDNHSVYTGEIARRDESARRVVKIRILNKRIPVITQQILRDEDGIELPPKFPLKEMKQINYLGKSLRTTLPRTTGFCSNFETIPNDSHLSILRPKNGLQWVGTNYDDELFSAIWCGRNFRYKDPILMAGSEDPLNRYDKRVIPIWTDENPKK